MPKNNIEGLMEVLKNHKGKKIVIPMRGAPDPDSISSALAHKMICGYAGVEAVIMHIEDVSHQENKALMKLLDIEIIRYTEDTDLSEFAGYCCVDSQCPDKQILERLKEKKCISIVDHHERVEGSASEFTDNRKDNVGATATIYAEYFRELDLLNEVSEQDKAIATALMHGIKSDTNKMNVARHIDYAALEYLSRYADLNLLEKISFQQLSPKTMDIIVLAYNNKYINDNYLISGVGIVRSGDRDAIPQAADYLLQRIGIDTVMVYGFVGDYIDCSLRTTNDGIRPGEWITTFFPDADGGGRKDKGGFRVYAGLPLISIKETRKELVCSAIDAYMKSRFYAAIGVEEQKPSDED